MEFVVRLSSVASGCRGGSILAILNTILSICNRQLRIKLYSRTRTRCERSASQKSLLVVQQFSIVYTTLKMYASVGAPGMGWSVLSPQNVA